LKNNLAYNSLFLAAALVLSYIESLIPIVYPVPGMKLGLPNMAIVMLLYMGYTRSAFIVDILRIVISGFMFGSLFGILFSISGAVFSFAIMYFIKKIDVFSIIGTSVCGGIIHNMAQLIVAMFVVKISGIVYYLPLLVLGGMITGFINGFIASRVIPVIKKL